MRSFDYIESGKTLLTPHTTSLLAAIHEAKGRQSIQTTIRPDILGTLVAVARIQSTDASNRIEGISTSDSRLNDLVSEKVTPRNRNEEEIAGYRDALSVIHESHDYIPITPNVILQLHRDLFRHTPLTFAGHFKDSDNVIIERDAHGTSTVRFAPPVRTCHTGTDRTRVFRLHASNPRWTYRSIACHRHVHSRFHLHTSVQ